MKQLFDDLSVEISRMTTRKYSTSFSIGIYFLQPCVRDAVYSIYGFVRVADEIVDSFTGYNKQQLLSHFRNDTYRALEAGISTNPILNAFQKVVHQYRVPHELINAFLDSMEMDLAKVEYTEQKYQQYIYGSAEVVGLMCLCVFCNGDRQYYEQLKPYAMRLGAAFQKVNFLRDAKSDYELLDRTYFPNVNLQEFNCETKRLIEADIEADFQEALTGIKMLPASSKTGVYLAYVYYHSLFKKIKKLPARKILQQRIRINNTRKIGLMLNSLVQQKLNWI